MTTPTYLFNDINSETDLLLLQEGEYIGQEDPQVGISVPEWYNDCHSPGRLAISGFITSSRLHIGVHGHQMFICVGDHCDIVDFS